MTTTSDTQAPDFLLAVPECSELVRVEDRGNVRILILNRAAKRNAMTDEMFDALAAELVAAGLDRSVSCVVLTGAGSAFCAGWDLQEMADPVQHNDGRRHGPVPCIEELARFPKPLLAAVHGAAVGFGATALLHCDVVVAAASARIRFPFVELGVAPEAGSSALLPALIGSQQAARLLLTAESITGDEAESLGLVLRSVPDPDVLPTTLGLADRIASMPAAALWATKGLLSAARLDSFRAAHTRETSAYAVLLGNSMARRRAARRQTGGRAATNHGT